MITVNLYHWDNKNLHYYYYYFIFFLDVIETIGEIIDERMINQYNCNCSLAKTKTGSLFSYNIGQNNSKTFDPVKVK